MFIKSTKINKQKSEKKSIFYLFVKNFVCTVLISILVFSIAFKNTITVLFSCFSSGLKNEKRMDAKVHGPTQTLNAFYLFS